MFGEDRLRQLVKQEAPAGAQALEQRILESLEKFTCGLPQPDDISFILIEKYG